MNLSLSEPSYVNWRWGGGQSLTPPTNPNDKNPDGTINRTAYEFGRTSVGSDETFQGVELPDGRWAIKSPNGRAWMCVELDGTLGERPTTSVPGSWETFVRNGNVLTENPKEGVTRPPVTFVLP